jgi:hypothetical protein
MPEGYSRTRSKGGNESYRWGTSYDGVGSGGSLPDDYFGAVRFKHYELIRDAEHLFRPGTHRYPAGWCHHVKITQDLTAMTPFLNDQGGHEYPKGAYPSLPIEPVLARMPAFPSSLLSDLSEQAFNTFSDRFPAQISFTEFVGGLGELKDLIPKLERSFTKTGSSWVLNKKFGWDNLLSDLRALRTLCKTMSARISWLGKTYGVPTRLGFYKGNCYQALPADDHYVDMTNGFGYGWRLVDDGYRADYRATCWLTQKLDHLNDITGLIRELTGALGLANPLKAAWVVLPGSFMVDWVFKVSQHLERLGKINPSEQWDTRDVCYSIHAVRRFKVYQDNRTRNGSNPLLYRGSVVCDEFKRGLGFPIGLDIYSPADLSPSQLTLLLALIGANT